MAGDEQGPRSPLRSVSVLISAGLALALIALLAWGTLTAAPGTRIDDDLAQGRPTLAPDYELEVLEPGRLGDRLGPKLGPALADGRLSGTELRGVPYVLNFWASWCVPCRDEAPLLQRSWERARRAGVLFVGLDMQDIRRDARDFLRDFDIDYLNIRDPGNGVARRYETTGIPETFFISARGEIVGHVVGVVTAEQMRAGIAAARAGRPAEAQQGGDQRPTR
jgi:cytochrome c biogenesis protein CcmG/thiol:disulfide interchange protein DsbE